MTTRGAGNNSRQEEHTPSPKHTTFVLLKKVIP